MLPGLTFVLGTAGSGKAGFAKTLVTGTGRGPVCILTAPADDPAAQSSLAGRETDWTILRAPRDIGRTLAGISGDSAVLLDALPPWLDTLIADGKDPAEAEAELMAGLALCAAPVIVLSCEPAPSDPPGLCAALSRLNLKLAAKAGLVVNVIAGLPQVLKGDLP
ncbi:bifunctional adenosylcobinamide kinase/adenosylcobinamide-phosphate guanylyltransferase [Roseovarius confluentis]|uniref:bifunctional adenosylcobinamide kinase/adenosylcobinamide-phosphate guanylyltransferase n=1 Tax=Roseovarius confluentis TaxID=1852027 RepID=UPI000CDD3963|nr:bifunctional adenosylcobinamide kinase/adenosylcobinamide-phosphate guanylyltransferase [Roseovarius confluentis]